MMIDAIQDRFGLWHAYLGPDEVAVANTRDGAIGLAQRVADERARAAILAFALLLATAAHAGLSPAPGVVVIDPDTAGEDFIHVEAPPWSQTGGPFYGYCLARFPDHEIDRTACLSWVDRVTQMAPVPALKPKD